MRMYYHSFDKVQQRFVVGWASSPDGFKYVPTSCPLPCLLLFRAPSVGLPFPAIRHAFCWAACPCPLLCLVPFSMPSPQLPGPALCFAFCPSACLLLGCLSLPFALPFVLQHAFWLAACLCPLLCLLPFSMPFAGLLSLRCAMPPALQHRFCLAVSALCFLLRPQPKRSPLRWAGAPSLHGGPLALSVCLLCCCRDLGHPMLPVSCLNCETYIRANLAFTNSSIVCSCTGC